MTFTRQQACLLANISVGRFKVLADRNQNVAWNSALEAEEQDWEPFERRPLDRQTVLMLAVQQALMETQGYSDGLSPETARKIVANAAYGISDALTAASGDIWIGHGGSGRETGGGHHVGSLLQIAAAAHQTSDARLFLVNVSAVLAQVRARAEANGIEF